MTVFKNMAYGLKMRRMPKEEIDRRVRAAAKILELSELLDRKPRQLSGGQRQRVAMGRCIVREPKVFLFDEPLSNLDAKLRVQMRLEIRKLHEELKITSIYVTHDQVEAMTLGDRLVVMDNGHAAQIGSPLEVYERPATVFVAGFIGSPAMNFVDATVEDDGSALYAVADGFRVRLPEAFAPSVRPYAGRAVVFGVRPEDIAAATGTGATLETRAEVVETLGSEIFAHLACGPRTIVARMKAPDVPLRVGDALAVELDMAKTHLFAPTTERTIV
jgi:multiple sugar transport system ATP-binding protein